MRTIVIAVLGETNTCKSALVKKMADLEAAIQPAPPDFSVEWDYVELTPRNALAQGKFVHVLPSGEKVFVKLLEMRAARGRAANFNEVLNALSSVQAVIHTDRVFKPQLDVQFVCKHVPYGKVLDSKSVNKREVPYLYACTGIDAISEERLEELTERAKAAGAKAALCRGTFMVSAVTGQGVAELRDAAIALALEHSTREESLMPEQQPLSFAQKLAALLPWGSKSPPRPEWVPGS